MSVLGRSYRIMYLARGRRTGLTDVQGAVLRPDDSVLGIYPLREGVGMFRGCYYYDFLSSPDDVEGEYFSLVISPTEGRSDIVRFGLYRQTDGQDQQAIRPVDLTGALNTVVLRGRLNTEGDVWAHVSLPDLGGRMRAAIALDGILSDTETAGRLTLNPQID